MTGFLTRIANNQIQANTITFDKLVDGTLVGQKFNSNLTLNSNVVIQGNLQINGTYITTTSVNTYVNDPLVVFNNGYTGSPAPSYDIGILVNRGLAAATGSNPNYLGGYNAAWVWREYLGGFQGILTQETGNVAGNIGGGWSYANLYIGNTVVKSASGFVDSTDTTTGAMIIQGGLAATANINIGSANTTWNKIAGNTYFGTTTLTYPAGGPTGQQAVETVKTFAGSAYNVSLVNSDASGHATFTQNTAAQGGQLTFVTYQSGNDINFSPNKIFSVSLAAANGSVIIQPTTDSLGDGAYRTGAFISQGGAAVQGNLNVAGRSTFNGVLIGGQYGGATANFQGLLIGANIVSSGISQVGTTMVGQYMGRGTVGANVTAIGSYSALTGVGAGSTLVGTQTGAYGTPGVNNTLVGYLSGAYNIGGQVNNSFYGYNAGSLVSTGYNVVVGSFDGNNNPYYPLNISNQGTNNIVLADGYGNVRIWVDPAGTTRIVSNTIATHTNANTGALIIEGGVGIRGNLQIAGNAMAINGTVFGGISSSNGGVIYIGGNVKTASIGANSIVVGHFAGTAGTAANATILGDSAGYANPGDSSVLVGKQAGWSVTSGSPNSTMIGSLAGKFAAGQNNQFFGYNAGSGILTGSYNTVLGYWDASANASVNNYVFIADGQNNLRIKIDNAGSTTITGITDATATAGALVVQGGASIAKKLYVGGDATVIGNLSVLGTYEYLNTTVTAITDPIIELNTQGNGGPLTTASSWDSGVKTHYYDTVQALDRKSFFGRSNDSGNFEYYANVASEIGNVITGTYGNIKAGEFHSANATNSTDKVGTVGAITTLGGASIAQDLYVGGTSYQSGITSTGTYSQTVTSTSFNVTLTGGAGTISLSSGATGSIDNIDIGQTTPAQIKARNFSLTTAGTPAGSTFLVAGGSWANITPVGALVIGPQVAGGNVGNMDNVYIGNVTPRQAAFTAANIGQDLVLKAFTSNSVLFVSQSGNLSVDQDNQAFNFQRLTANTFSTVALGLGHVTQNDLLAQGTDTLNIRYQGDSYLPQSLVSANTLGQTSGWTVSTTRGTPTAPVINQDGDFNGVFGAYSWSGATPQFYETGAWRYVVQGTTGAASGIGGQAQLWTKRDNGASTLAMRVDASQVATFTGQVVVANTTIGGQSTNGALYVTGGVGIGGNVVVAGGMRVNDAKNSTTNGDFIVRGSNDSTLIWASTSNAYNQVIIGNSATAVNQVVGAKLQIFSNDSILLPTGDDGTRPGTPIPGMLRYNTNKGDLDFYNGAGWQGVRSGQAGIWYDNQFVGDGISTQFPLTRDVTTNSALVSINGIVQIPGAANSYTISANVITFSEAPQPYDTIDVRMVSVPYEIRGIQSTLGNVTINAGDFGANIDSNVIASSTSITTQITFRYDGAIVHWGKANTAVGVSTVTLDSFVPSAYRTAKYLVQVSNYGLNTFESSEVIVISNGTTAQLSQFGRVYTGAAPLGTISATVSGGSVLVQYTGAATGNYVHLKREYIAG